jgi:hypothetical protein
VRRGRPAVALTVIVLTLGALGVVEVLSDPVEETAPTPVALAGSEAVSGGAVCAVGDAREGTSTAVDLVRPGESGDTPATAEVRSLEAGDEASLLATRLFPGSGARVDLEGGEEVATDVRWSGAPVSVTRSWRIDDEEDLPPGTAAGPCAPGTSATRWTVPGLATDGGHEARLRLANPHPSGATVSVGFLTPEGPEDPTRLRNVSIGPDETVEIVLNEYLPEQPDLSAIVSVESGRVAVEGVQLTRNAIGGIDGVSLLQATTAPASTWTVPWVVDGEERASWLWIANEGDRSAPVELSLHTPDGGIVPEGLAEVTVPPGTVRRVDLRGTLPEGVDNAAITARSDGVPVSVSAVVRLSAEDPDDTGFAVQLAAAADPIWTLSGSGREGRSEQLRLVNPGSEPATVDVTLWNGSTVSAPEELAGIEVPAGALVVVPLSGLVEPAPAWSLVVRATGGPVVAGTVGSGDPDGPRHLVATVGAPSEWWRTPRAPVLRWAPGTTQRLGTELGIAPLDPLAPPEPSAPEAPSTDVDGTEGDDGGGEVTDADEGAEPSPDDPPDDPPAGDVPTDD